MFSLEKIIRYSRMIIECSKEWRMEPRAAKAGKGPRGNKAANKGTLQKVYIDLKLYYFIMKFL